METPTQTRSFTDRPACAISWSAIFSGALVAFSLSALFNLLNSGLGLVAFPESFRALTTVTIAGYIWLIICAAVAMFIAGFVAGKILRHYSPAPCTGFLHGFLAWSVALLFSVIVASHFMEASALNSVAASNVAATNTTTAADDSQNSGNSANSNNADTTSDNSSNQAQIALTARALGGVTIGIFLIFLIGAIFAGIGGHVGASTGSRLDRY